MIKSLKDIKTYENDKILLRKPNLKVVSDYSILMRDSVKFPPIILGEYILNEHTHKLIVDGIHRFLAACDAGLQGFEVEIKHYTTETEALLDMLKLNEGRGLQVSPKERNTRIKLLLDSGIKQADLAKQLNLTQASISRINAEKQATKGTGKGSRTTESQNPSREPSHKEIKPYAPKAFCEATQRMYLTLKHKTSKASLMDYLMPEGSDGIDKEIIKTFDVVATGLKGLLMGE